MLGRGRLIPKVGPGGKTRQEGFLSCGGDPEERSLNPWLERECCPLGSYSEEQPLRDVHVPGRCT